MPPGFINNGVGSQFDRRTSNVNLCQHGKRAVIASQLYRSQGVRRVLAAALLVGLAVAVGAFVVDASDDQPDPVSFDLAVTFELPAEDRRTLEEQGLSIPRVQVFYSQYPYVVGYEGVERAVDVMGQPAHAQQFGHPMTVYVSDYAGTGVAVTEAGYLDTDREPGWVSADDAWFVVDSAARTTVSETIVPFGDEHEARAFADRYGGSVVEWSTVESTDIELSDASAVRDAVPGRQGHADNRTASVAPRLERNVSVVAGEDAPTVQAAIDNAEPNSTVLVPPGTYDEHVTVDRPVTLRGADATLRGDGNGTVVEVTHDRAALSGLSITGVGKETRDDDVEATGDWDESFDVAYGHSDAGVRVVEAPGVYLHNLTVETPTSGVVYRDAPDGVVEGLAVDGTDDPLDGFMGVLSIRSPLVVQDVVVEGGRDGVYLHRAHGTVIRNSTFLENRFGVHLMYTSESLIAGNVAREQASAGVIIMSTPARNAVVDNDVRHASDGIGISGSRSYVAGNVLAYNDRGLAPGTKQSLYERNVVYGNDLGVRSGTTLPSNVLRENDFVDNDDHAKAGMGPLRVWTDGGTGNYWEGAHGDRTGSTLDGSYSPTDPVEERFHRTDGTVTLAASPAATALAEIRTTSAGLRQGNIVDTAPLAEPASPAVIEELREGPADVRTTLAGGETDD